MTIIDRSEDGLVLDSLPDGSYAWLRPAEPETQPVEVKTATPADLLRDHHRFERWLNEQPADATVGRSGFSNSCPLATYLTAEGFDHVRVYCGTFHWGQHETYQQADAPAWARQFVEAVDWPHWAGAFIRASHARALLHQVVRGSHD